ncbi:hypothetical protein AB4345_05305 [Vibrio breoganii]
MQFLLRSLLIPMILAFLRLFVRDAYDTTKQKHSRWKSWKLVKRIQRKLEPTDSIQEGYRLVKRPCYLTRLIRTLRDGLRRKLKRWKRRLKARLAVNHWRQYGN